jgi:ribose transport system substrate-binding protein
MTARKIVVWACAISLFALLFVVVAYRRASRPKVIAVVPETTAQEIWESEHAGAAHAAHAFGWEVYWNGPSREDDFPLQARIVRRAIARNIAGLVLSPDHDVVLISAVQEALDKGIPTVIVGSPLGISPGNRLTFVVNDDAATGRLAAERAAKSLKPGDAVAILGLNPNLLSSIARANAFEQAASRTGHILPQSFGNVDGSVDRNRNRAAVLRCQQRFRRAETCLGERTGDCDGRRGAA